MTLSTGNFNEKKRPLNMGETSLRRDALTGLLQEQF